MSGSPLNLGALAQERLKPRVLRQHGDVGLHHFAGAAHQEHVGTQSGPRGRRPRRCRLRSPRRATSPGDDGPDIALAVVDRVHHLGHAVAGRFRCEILYQEGHDQDAGDRDQDDQRASGARRREHVGVVVDKAPKNATLWINPIKARKKTAPIPVITPTMTAKMDNLASPIRGGNSFIPNSPS